MVVLDRKRQGNYRVDERCDWCGVAGLQLVSVAPVGTALAQTVCTRLGLARPPPPGRRTFDPSIDPTPVPRERLSISDHRHQHRALASTHIALQIKDLLPGSKHQLSIRDGYGQ